MEKIALLFDKDTRDSTHKILTDFASVLSGQETTNEDLEKLEGRSKLLIYELNKLQRINLPTQTNRIARKTSGGLRSPNLSLAIPYNLKMEVVNLLQKNMDCAIKYSGNISKEIEKELNDENGSVIEKLNHLVVCPDSATVIPDKILCAGVLLEADQSSETDQSSEDEDDQTPRTSTQPDQQSSILKRLGELEKRMDDKLSGLQSQVTGVLNSLERVVTFNLPNVQAFFGGSSVKKSSEPFFCRSIQWSILACYEKKSDQVSDNSKSLQLHLFREKDPNEHKDETAKWKIDTKFEIRVLAQSGEVVDKIESFDFVFGPEFSSFGETEFASYSQLKSGYLKADGSIDIRVDLKINSIKRSVD